MQDEFMFFRILQGKTLGNSSIHTQGEIFPGGILAESAVLIRSTLEVSLFPQFVANCRR